MKFIAIFIFAITHTAYGKEASNFNRVLLDEVKKEISNDDEYLKKTPQRGPASVAPTKVPTPIQDTSKIDRNVRQIGPDSW